MNINASKTWKMFLFIKGFIFQLVWKSNQTVSSIRGTAIAQQSEQIIFKKL